MWKKYSNGADEQLASVDKAEHSLHWRGLPPRDSAARAANFPVKSGCYRRLMNWKIYELRPEVFLNSSGMLFAFFGL